MKLELIEDWFNALWTLASTRLAIVAGFIVWVQANYAQEYADFVATLDWWQKVLLAFIVWTASTGSRVVTFAKK